LKNIVKDKEFIVMNEEGLYFKGLFGNGVVWTTEYKEAKPLDNIKKFETLQKMCRGIELIYDYI